MEPTSALLEHADFLRRIAMQLAGPDAADDLAQDTWAATLQRPPRHDGNPRSWLATIATNLWRNHRRAASRRAARERLAQPGDAVPGVDVIAAREEVRRRVVAAVLALPEGLRDVVLLRFYEGLDSKAIGRRLQRPSSTVRTQLQTAIERLRQRLDDDHDGRRAAWLVPLVQWRRFLPESAGLPSGLTIVAGPVAALLLLGLVALVGVQLWSSSMPATPVVTPAVAGEPAAVTPSSEWLQRNAPVATPPAPLLPPMESCAYFASQPQGTLRGRVVDAVTGAPIAGARVALRSIESGGTALSPVRDTRDVTRSLVTAVDGTFATGQLPAGPYEVETELDDGRAGRDSVSVGQGEQSVDLAVRSMPFRGVVLVKVVDTARFAVAGAEVRVAAICTKSGPIGLGAAPPIRGTSDARGLFRYRDATRLEHVFEGYVVATCADGRVGAATIARPEHRGNDPWVEVVVDRPGVVVGAVTGPRTDWTGLSIAPLPVFVYDHAEPGLAVRPPVVAVAADGGFRCEGLPPGRYHLQVTGAPDLRRGDAPLDQGWQFLPVVTVPAGGEVAAKIELLAQGHVRGRVVDREDRPVVGATVQATFAEPGPRSGYWHEGADGEPRGLYDHASTESDLRGEYDLGLPPGRWNVAVTRDGLDVDLQLGVEVGDGVTALEHRLEPDGGLRGRCRASRIDLRRADGTGVVQHVPVANGGFAVRGLRPGDWQIGRDDDGAFAVVATARVDAGVIAWLDLDLIGDGLITGQARLDGAPLADLDVRLWGGRATVTTDRDGAFSLATPTFGRSRDPIVEFLHHGLSIATRTVERGGANDVGLGAIELAVRRLDLRAQDEAGAAVPATFWIVIPASVVESPRWFAPGGRRDGQLVPAGEVVWVEAAFADGSEVRAEVAADASATVVLTSRPTGGLAIRVLDADGCPRASANLTLLPWAQTTPAPADGATFWTGRAAVAAHLNSRADTGPRYARTDAEGRVVVRGLAPGPVLVWFSGPWGQFGYQRNNALLEGPPPAECVATVVTGSLLEVELVMTR